MSTPKLKGTLVVSLDFELYWGVRDARTLESYKRNLLAVRRVVPALLKLFQEYGTHATWATVGLMFFETREQLIDGLPSLRPNYVNPRLSPYHHIDELGRDEKEDPFHYAPSLIKLIASFPHQEIGSHTFSHYYCLEKGQNDETFRADLEAAVRSANRYNVTLESLVFPRNQFNDRYLSICREVGIKAYRGNESSWMYRAKSREDESLLRRGVRLLDAYVNLSGHNCYAPQQRRRDRLLNIPSSRFLRPYSKTLRLLEPLRMRRILADMTYAAQRGLIYHLWWHPHNFGENTDENLSFLKKILDCHLKLREMYDMESLNMAELSERICDGHESTSKQPHAGGESTHGPSTHGRNFLPTQRQYHSNRTF